MKSQPFSKFLTLNSRPFRRNLGPVDTLSRKYLPDISQVRTPGRRETMVSSKAQSRGVGKGA